MEKFNIPIRPRCKSRFAGLIEEAASYAGLQARMKSTLSKYPGCIHWHFKRGEERGVLEATYWPKGQQAWLSWRAGREAEWIYPAIQSMMAYIAEACGQ